MNSPASQPRDVLTRIVERTSADLAERKRQLSLGALHSQIAGDRPYRDFLAAVYQPGRLRLIAEVKKASPSAGVIREDFDPVAIARCYAECGAAAISVLTDEPFFQGSLTYLRQIRDAVDLPLLRKDFIVDEYQIAEAAVAGADAILLIAEILPGGQLQRLYDAAVDYQLHVLLECYDEENIPRAVATGCQVIGVNNRDLRSFQVDLQRSCRLRAAVPSDRCFVSESGIRVTADLERLESHGVNAILVGEQLTASPDIAQAVRSLMGTRIT